MLFHCLDGHFLPVEDPCGQSGFHIGLFKDLREVFNLSGTRGGDLWDRDAFANVFYKFNVKGTIGTIFVNTVQEDVLLPRNLKPVFDRMLLNFSSEQVFEERFNTDAFVRFDQEAGNRHCR